MEMWRPIKDLPGYSVSNKGRVKKDSTGVSVRARERDGKLIHGSLWELSGHQFIGCGLTV